jgi:hypothetical protein
MARTRRHPARNHCTASIRGASLAACALSLLNTVSTLAAPVTEPWASSTTGPVAAVDAADLSGWYAAADTAHDAIEIRDIRQSLVHRITRDDILVHAPWMSLDAGPDGPAALAWTDSGRSLFIVVTDASPSTDGLGSDVILRYDTATEQLTRFARAEIGDGTGPGPAAMHFRGELWVSTQGGPIRVYHARRTDSAGSLRYSWSLPGNAIARGMGVARRSGHAFVVSDQTLYRVDLNAPFASAVTVGPLSSARGVAYTDHLGASSQEGIYVAEATAPGTEARIRFIPRLQALGQTAYAPVVYAVPGTDLSDLTATACGRLLLAAESGPLVLRDTADTRLGYEAWVRDEFDQVLTFARGLVAPDGIPAGWVTDADVALGGTRFHPASPDAAAWSVLLQIADDYLAGNQASLPTVRTILRRYAGLMPDGIAPVVSADGIMRHWHNPWTGGAAPGWDPEFATMSTMLLVAAADRARRFYADDAALVEAADTIIGRVRNWDSYLQAGSNALYLRAMPNGGPDFGTASAAFNEGILFVEQAAAYDEAGPSLAFWLDRSQLPQAVYVPGLPLTTDRPGEHLPAFVSLYPWVVQAPFRSDPSWRAHVSHLLASNGAWTDDNAPRFMTVFSAGTTRPDWGGYHADSLSDHPGDVTTFPSLMGFASLGQTAPSVAAYHAYRRGARQSFATGASLLFRRSQVDPGYTPPDAGLPDVAIGALGLAELIKPGAADAVCAVPYRPACQADLAAPHGVLDFFDLAAFLGAFSTSNAAADLARPFGQFDFFDVSAYLTAFNAGCP